MSQVTTVYTYKANVGETISSAKANNLYANINTASTTINADNTRTEAISRRHLYDLSELPSNVHVTFTYLKEVGQHLASGNYNSTTYVDITHGVTASITPPAGSIVLRPNEAIRLQFSVMVEAAVKGATGTARALETNNYYFRFFVNINGVLTAVSPEYGYSLLADATPSAGGGGPNGWAPSQSEASASFSDIANQELIVQVRVAQSYIYINKTANDQTITETKPRVRVQVPNGTATANTITLKEFEFVSMGVR